MNERCDVGCIRGVGEVDAVIGTCGDVLESVLDFLVGFWSFIVSRRVSNCLKIKLLMK